MGDDANGIETYWRGLLSQDYAPNPTYEEAAQIGAELKRLGPSLAGLQKHNEVAMYFSNRALTAFDAFKFGWGSRTTYNDVLRPFYDALYRANVETDFVDPSTKDLSRYKLIIAPALYAASDAEIDALKSYVREGGHLVLTFKAGFSDENVKVRSTPQPGRFADAVGATYSQFAIPENVSLKGGPKGDVRWWMEFLKPTTATVVASYQHAAWGEYAAVTRNRYGKGEVTYIGCMPSDSAVDELLGAAVERAGVARPAGALRFPIVARRGVSGRGRTINYLLNYSGSAQSVAYPFGAGVDLLAGKSVAAGERIDLGKWGVAIVEEAAR